MKRFFILIFIVFSLFTACHENKKKVSRIIRFNGLVERKIEVTRSITTEGFLMGVNFDRNEIYTTYISPSTRKHVINIIDIDTGNIKKGIEYEYGTFDSPTSFFNPTNIHYYNRRYLIIDQFHKIFVFNEQLEYQFTNMFVKPRYFIDFYALDNNMFFVIGERITGANVHQNTVQLYRFLDHNRPEFARDLAVFQYKALGVLNRRQPDTIYSGYFWPSGMGFEKQGKIYYSDMLTNTYYSYDVLNGKTDSFELSYLKPRKYSNDEATRLGLYESNGWQKNMMDRFKTRVIHVSYPEPLYYYGIHDIGNNKIGIVGDIESKNYKFRLDIIDIKTARYIESVWMPSGAGFRNNLGDNAKGGGQSFINVDKGIYVFYDEIGDEFIDSSVITFFKIRRDTGATNGNF